MLPGGNTGRSVLPDDFTPALRYQITLTGPETLERETAGGRVTVFLEPGEWTVTVRAYDGNTLVGTGRETVTVVRGVPASITIKMYVEAGYEALLKDIYIHSEAELRRIGTDFAIDGSKSFHLENDISLTQPWTPLGNENAPFKALFDGQGHTLTMSGGLNPAALRAETVGFIGYADGAEIRNLGIVWNMGSAASPVQVPMPSGAREQHIGGLAGTLDNASRVENVSVRGSFCFRQTGSTDGLLLGGIAGFVTEGSAIQSCSVRDATIYGNSDTTMKAGGVAGFSDEGASIKKSSFSGTVSSGGMSGGITGSSFDTLISECHAAGTVKGADGAGGIAGEMQISGGTSSIEASSFTGTVSAVASIAGNVYAGGIAGSIYDASIKYCYAAGTVKSENLGTYSYAGGIAGSAENNSHIENCYAYTQTSSYSTYGENAGGIAGNLVGSISKCYAAGTVKSEGRDPYTYVGGIVGYGSNTIAYCMVMTSEIDAGPTTSSSKHVHAISGDSSTLTGNYSRNDITRRNADSGDSLDPGSGNKDGEAKPLADFKTAPLYSAAGWGFDTGNGGDWKWINGYDYPVLSWQTAAPDLSVFGPLLEPS
jgi:hypothetical protein